MNIRTPRLFARIFAGAHDSLYRNSFFLMASTGTMSVFGFLFWAICARLYSAEQVGLAASLISITALLTNLSFLGFNSTLIRYIPRSHQKSTLVNTALAVSATAAIIATCIFLGGLHTFAPQLTGSITLAYWLLLISYVVATTSSAMLDSLFVAERVAHKVLIKNTTFSVVKLGLPFVLIGLGFWGIFVSTAIAAFVALALSVYFAYRRGIHFQPAFDKEVLTETRHFAAGNYLASLFGAIPSTVLPLVVASRLGSEAAAYFYMPMMITTLLNVIPSASAQSLFAEASHDTAQLVMHVKKAFKGTMALLLPAALGVVVLGNIALLFFGEQYSHQGMEVLRLLALASIFGAINYLGDTVLNIRKRIKSFVGMNVLNSLSILLATWLLMNSFGLTGVGVGWLLGQLLTMVIYVIFFGRQELRATK